jgi:hypothetical protein
LLASEIFLEAPTIDPESFYRFVETPPDANGHVGYKVYDKETGMAITFRGENASTEAEEWIDKNDQRRKAKLLKQKQKQQRFKNKEQYKKVATDGYKKFLGGRTTYRLMKFITLAERGNNVLLYIRRYYAAYAENGCSEKRIETNKSPYGNRLVYDDMIYLKKKTADTIAEAVVQVLTGWATGTISTIAAIKLCSVIAAIFAITAPAAIIWIIGIIIGVTLGYAAVPWVEKFIATEWKPLGKTLGDYVFYLLWLEVAGGLVACNESAGKSNKNILIEQKRINEDLEQAKNAFLKIAEKLYNQIYNRFPNNIKSSIEAITKYIKNLLK